MADEDGESIEVQGPAASRTSSVSAASGYVPGVAVNRSSKSDCKHLQQARDDDAEETRIGDAVPEREKKTRMRPACSAERWDGAMDLAGWWMSEARRRARTGLARFLSRQGTRCWR